VQATTVPLVDTELGEAAYFNHPLRVLAAIPGDGQGNSFVFARRQVASLARAGITIQTLYLDPCRSVQQFFTQQRRLRRAIQAFSPHIVHAHYGTVTSFLCAIGTGEPLIITFRGSDLNRDARIGFVRGRLGLLLSQLSALRASAIICTSSQLMDRLWWRRNKATVLPSGADLVLFKPDEMQKSRELIGWEPDEGVVVFNAGKNPLIKGLPLAREAVAIVQSKFGPVRFFEFDGSTPPETMPTYLNAADCLLLASESEGSPNIVKEALACNLPIVSLDVGDVAERLRGVSPSFIVDRDPRQIARALIEVLSEKKRSNGREHVVQLSETRISEQLYSIYKSIISGDQQSAGAAVSADSSR
jgi:teichuronic acid biosynthesis glycosyltransferase TuaC